MSVQLEVRGKLVLSQHTHGPDIQGISLEKVTSRKVAHKANKQQNPFKLQFQTPVLFHYIPSSPIQKGIPQSPLRGPTDYRYI